MVKCSLMLKKLWLTMTIVRCHPDSPVGETGKTDYKLRAVYSYLKHVRDFSNYIYKRFPDACLSTQSVATMWAGGKSRALVCEKGTCATRVLYK
jgi:hypothetical protein